jgi:hypothetical protein
MIVVMGITQLIMGRFSWYVDLSFLGHNHGLTFLPFIFALGISKRESTYIDPETELSD